jgi:predicted NBD/HSP70 family sugar kinase
MIVVPSKMGRLNKRALLERLQVIGSASRATLAKSIGLSQPTAGKIVEEFLHVGVLEETTPYKRKRRPADQGKTLGRPGRIVRLAQSKPRFVAIQLGVSETSIVVLPVGGCGEDNWKLRISYPNSSEIWLQQLQKAAGKLPVSNTFWGVLVSVPGIVDESRRKVIFSPNLHWTENADLPELIQKVWNLPVFLVQEERALALGHQAVSRDKEGFLLVDIGEGVGGAVIMDGKLNEHPLPMSGELGHSPVSGNNRPCGCGAKGCLETLISRSGLLETFKTQTPEAQPTWSGFVDYNQRMDLPSWFGSTLDATAAAIATALNVIGLRHVVVTGILSELPPTVFDYLSNAIQRGALWGRFGRVQVEHAPRRRTAGLVAVALDRLVLPMLDGDQKKAYL